MSYIQTPIILHFAEVLMDNSTLAFLALQGEVGELFFGDRSPLVYVNNPKCACTTAKNLIFFVNKGYEYNTPGEIHFSQIATWRLGGEIQQKGALKALLSRERVPFSFVRNPIQRFVSAVASKVLSDKDPVYKGLRERLTSWYDVPLACPLNPSDVALRIADLLTNRSLDLHGDEHFRPQVQNVGRISHILRLEQRSEAQEFLKSYCTEDVLQWFQTRRFNESDRELKVQMFSKDLEEKLKQFYSEDYVAFGYSTSSDVVGGNSG